MKKPSIISHLLLFIAATAAAQFVAPTVSTQVVTTDDTGDLISPFNFFTENGPSIAAQAPVQSVAGKSGTVTLDKTDVGLANVDNTSDADKPVSNATQTALNLKLGATEQAVDVDPAGAAIAAALAGKATAAQGALADTATQPGDNVSTLTNDAGYLDSSTGIEESEVDQDVKTLSLPASVTISPAVTTFDQSVASGASPTFNGSNFTGIDADTLDGLNSTDFATVEALNAVEVGLVGAVDLRGVRSDGTQEALILPVRDYHISNHTIGGVFKRLVGQTLLLTNQNSGGTLGERIFIESDGTLTFEIADGADFTTHTFTTTQSADIAVGAYGEIIAVIDRSGDVDFYSNGTLVESLDISSASGQSVSSGANWLVLSDGTTHYDGAVTEKLLLVNDTITAQEITDRFYDNSLWFTPEGAIGAIALPYTIAGVGGSSGWNDSFGTASEQDAVAGLDDWIKFVPDTTDTNHSARWVDATAPMDFIVEVGENYRVSGTFYSPSTNGDNLNGVRITTLSAANFTSNTADFTTATKDAIVEFSYEFTANQLIEKLFFYPLLGGAFSYAGDGTSYILLNNLTIERIGTEDVYDLRPTGVQKPSTISDNYAYYVYGGGVQDQDDLSDTIKLTGTFTSDGWLVYDQTSDEIYGADYFLRLVTFEELSGNTVTVDIGTTVGGAEVVNAEALSASSLSFGTLVTKTPTTRKFHVNSSAWSGAEVKVTITLEKR